MIYTHVLNRGGKGVKEPSGFVVVVRGGFMQNSINLGMNMSRRELVFRGDSQ